MKNASRQRFESLCADSGVSEHKGKDLWKRLTNRYAERHRRYHNLKHVDRMLGWLDETGEASQPLEWAIWFHDIVYEPLSIDNEAQSAALFREELGDTISGSLIENVEKLILATDLRRERTGRKDEDLLIDIDLGILGVSTDEYESYRLGIREEYAMVPETEFKAGRKSVLQRFLSASIYGTPHFTTREKQARRNVEKEIEMLS